MSVRSRVQAFLADLVAVQGRTGLALHAPSMVRGVPAPAGLDGALLVDERTGESIAGNLQSWEGGRRVTLELEGGHERVVVHREPAPSERVRAFLAGPVDPSDGAWIATVVELLEYVLEGDRSSWGDLVEIPDLVRQYGREPMQRALTKLRAVQVHREGPPPPTRPQVATLLEHLPEWQYWPDEGRGDDNACASCGWSRRQDQPWGQHGLTHHAGCELAAALDVARAYAEGVPS